MSVQDKKMLDREAVRTVIQQWNANRLDLFALSEPDENLLFHGVMRFYFQDAGQKVATKCIRVASDATVSDVIETLIEKFRPDMRMLSVPNYALYEVHSNGEERRLSPDEKPLLVQLNWHIDDREGRFLLRNIDQKTTPIENTDNNFKRKLSKREKKEQKKKEKLAKLNSDAGISNTGIAGDENHVAEKLYTELPETSFTRSISNPEAVMRRRRQQKLEKKLQQFRSRDGGPDTGGTLKIYGESLCRDVPYKTLLLSIRDCAQAVVREMLAKYGLDKADPLHYCLVQVNSDGTEYILDDDECPLSILMNHPTSRGSIMFHVRRRPADSQPRRRKKKPLGVSNGTNSITSEREGPMLVEVTHSGDGGRRVKLNNSDPIEVGSANTNSLQLFGPSIQARHCLISLLEGVCTVTPLHPDALTFVNGHHITQPTILHNGSVVMFGRVASYRFIDSPSDGRYNLALSQSQLDSACLYESRSPQSWNEDEHDLSPVSQILPTTLTNLTKKAENLSQINNKAELQHQQGNSGSIVQSEQPMVVSGGGSLDSEDNKSKIARAQGLVKETDFNYDPDEILENETKSNSSVKSGGSNNPEVRTPKISSIVVSGEQQQGQEPILPAVLEFPETHQENFLRQVIIELDVNAPNFKLAPVYTLYLCARYRASTHYRPELQPTERAHKLTIFLHHVANLVYSIIQDQYTDPRILAFWMANSSEFLHFLKSDRHISAFSVQAQEVLAESVQTAFRNLVNCFRIELSQTLNQFLSENIDHDSAAGLVLTVLGSAMALLRRCRVNAALTIQLFSQLFHYINVTCFNTIVGNSHMCNAEWGKVISERLQLLELWAERQGLELAADCHLAKINQCAQFLQAPKTSVEEIQQLACSCFRLNSLQMTALLQQEKIPRNLVDTAIRMAESVADELTRADGREVRLEESPELHLALLLPDDGFSCDVVRGIPSGLVDFLNPLQVAGMCRLAAQPTSVGLWTVYMHQFNTRSPSAMSNKLPQPEMQVIKLHKNSNGMGLSIVAAKGAGQERLGIYIKSVVPGGAADADGRLQAGDQLLRVDGQSLIGITQERAADYLVRTGPVVTLEVAKQGAIYHGLATLLQQPSPVIQRGNRRASERDISRMGDIKNSIGQIVSNQPLPNSKSVPALHHGVVNNMAISNSKSRSIHNLVHNNNEQGFYQNLSVYRAQNQNQPVLGERHQMLSQPTLNTLSSGNLPQQQQPISAGMAAAAVPTSTNHPTLLNRPTSAYYNNNANINNHSNNKINNVTSIHSPNSMLSYISASSNNLTNGNVNMSQHMHQQQQMLHQIQPHSSLTMGNRSKSSQCFARDIQTQQSLRMNQMMAPSMPNIAGHSNVYASQISSSQSMQNVNMIPNQQLSSVAELQQPPHQHSHNYPTGQLSLIPTQQHHSESGQYHPQNQPMTAQIRSQGKLIEMAEMAARRNQRHDKIMQGIEGTPNNSIMLPHNPNSQQQQQQQQQPQLQTHTMPSKMQQMSPIKQMPPTAPKPHAIRNQLPYSQQPMATITGGIEENTPPLPPTTTHPLFKNSPNSTQGINYVASTLDPPKAAYYPITTNTQNKNFLAASPWEREEREKEHEIRREHIRQWRDQQISELSLIGQRTQQQEDQLKTLVLERDFERRALETEEQDDDNDNSYNKDNVQEVIRLVQQNLTILTPVTNFRQVDVKVSTQNSNNSQINNTMNQDEISPTTNTITSNAVTTTSSQFGIGTSSSSSVTDSHQNQNYPPVQQTVQSASTTTTTTTIQPKSILKNNRYDGITTTTPTSPSKSHKSASFADDHHRLSNVVDHSINQLAKDIGNVHLSPNNDMTPMDLTRETLQTSGNTNPSSLSANTVLPPPPPPERNSSYLIMSQQQQKLKNPTLIRNNMSEINSNIIDNSNNGYLINSGNTISSSSLETKMQRPSLLLTNNNNILTNPQILHSSMAMNQQQQNNVVGGGNLGSTASHILLSSQMNISRDNKRVSFHDDDNNFISSQDLNSERPDLEVITENRCGIDTSAMLQSPTTPDASDGWNTTVQLTPGVIGAQEVYRDPRTRRLAEEQQKKQQISNDAVPEKLSFKEKIKMFALESGENQTPKDKLKISRAQRDIDAVH